MRKVILVKSWQVCWKQWYQFWENVNSQASQPHAMSHRHRHFNQIYTQIQKQLYPIHHILKFEHNWISISGIKSREFLCMKSYNDIGALGIGGSATICGISIFSLFDDSLCWFAARLLRELSFGMIWGFGLKAMVLWTKKISRKLKELQVYGLIRKV